MRFGNVPDPERAVSTVPRLSPQDVSAKPSLNDMRARVLRAALASLHHGHAGWDALASGSSIR
jgi:hypothetical protein